MKNVTVGWIKSSGWKSERHVPTLWIGKRNIALGSKNEIDIVILDGYDKLEPDYVENLENVGYTLIDGSKYYEKHARNYSALNRFGIYEKYCFLRWLVLQDLYSGSPLIHYDGDIVFNEIPENLGNKLGKFTFVLQGCPAFVSIKDPAWLEEYKKNLDLFCENIDSYSSLAWNEREGWEKSHKEKWAGYRIRKIISSDQDFISHLIHTGRIMQDNPLEVKASNPDLILFQNPLYFFTHNLDLGPFTYHRENSVDYFNDRKVAFWHLQGNFVAYLRAAFIQKYLLKLPLKVTNSLEWSDTTPFEHTLNKIHFAARLSSQIVLDRLTLCKLFFEKYDFSYVFDKKTFWKYPTSNKEIPSLDYPINNYYQIIFRR